MQRYGKAQRKGEWLMSYAGNTEVSLSCWSLAAGILMIDRYSRTYPRGRIDNLPKGIQSKSL